MALRISCPARESVVRISGMDTSADYDPRYLAGIVLFNRGDYFEEVIFAETGRKESLDVLIIQPPALLDHRFRQSRQRSEFTVLRQTTLTNGLDIRRSDTLRARVVWNATAQLLALVTASVSRTIWTCASVKLPPCTFPNKPTRLLIRTGEVDMPPMRFGIMPKADCNCCIAGFEPSGADSTVLTGNVVI